MAPQESIPVTASVLGTIGTVYETPLTREELLLIFASCEVAGVFRIWYNWRRKETDGLPGAMLLLWGVAAVPFFGVYNIVQNFNIPLQIQPQVFCCFTLICWAQTLIYHNHWRVWTASLVAVSMGVIWGGIEAALILTLQGPHSKGHNGPIIAVGVVAAVVLAIGLLPPYFELAKRKGRVIGINFVFLSVDFAGALFSLMALVAQQSFDLLGGILYIVCMFLEIGIFGSQLIWLYRTRKVRREAKLTGKTYDDYVRDDESTQEVSGTPDRSETPSLDGPTRTPTPANDNLVTIATDKSPPATTVSDTAAVSQHDANHDVEKGF